MIATEIPESLTLTEMTEVKLIHLKNIFCKYLEFILFFLPDSDVHDVWVSIISMFLELNYRVSSAAAAAVCVLNIIVKKVSK